MMTDSLKGKTALVTGASRGIGHGIALALGRQGATVIGTATKQEGVERISHTFNHENIQGSGMMLNVTSPESIINLMSAIKEKHGYKGKYKLTQS